MTRDIGLHEGSLCLVASSDNPNYSNQDSQVNSSDFITVINNTYAFLLGAEGVKRASWQYPLSTGDYV